MTALALSEMVERARVCEEAQRWLGTPYHHEARVLGSGVDCGQLLAAVYEGAGIVAHVATDSYPHDWMLHRDEERFLAYVEQYARPVPIARPGDVALFRFGRCISHGGIMLDDDTIIHAYVGLGVISDNLQANIGLHERLAGFWSPWRTA